MRILKSKERSISYFENVGIDHEDPNLLVVIKKPQEKNMKKIVKGS